MKRALFCLIMTVLCKLLIAQTYIAKNAEFTFFSEAPLEDIKATSNEGVSALNTKTGEIYFKVPIRSFKFKKGLMQEHFNENYMESDKYPYAEFKGTIQETLNYTQDGIYPITVQGDLTIHNVSKVYLVKANLKIKESVITGQTTFNVSVADHDIKIPRLVVKNIAEVVEVSVSAVYKILNKKD